jgi:O-antigen/teichoic acid export membrane protein
MLGIFASPDEVGKYAVLYQIGFAPIGILTGVAVALLGPILFQRSGTATDVVRNQRVHRMAWTVVFYGLMLTLCASLMTNQFHREIFEFAVGADYREASYNLPWMVLAGGVFASAQILGVKLASDLKVVEQILPKISTAVVGVIFNLVGARWFGLDGVVFSLVAFSSIYFIWMACISWRPQVVAPL